MSNYQVAICITSTLRLAGSTSSWAWWVVTPCACLHSKLTCDWSSPVSWSKSTIYRTSAPASAPLWQCHRVGTARDDIPPSLLCHVGWFYFMLSLGTYPFSRNLDYSYSLQGHFEPLNTLIISAVFVVLP